MKKVQTVEFKTKADIVVKKTWVGLEYYVVIGKSERLIFVDGTKTRGEKAWLNPNGEVIRVYGEEIDFYYNPPENPVLDPKRITKEEFDEKWELVGDYLYVKKES
jgi:hypothetical protein